MDALDSKVLKKLSINGRISWAELASSVGLSAPSVAERVKRLEEKEIIRGYSLTINYSSLGYNITAFIAVNLAHPKYIAGFVKEMNAIDEIEECHHVAGDDDYILKVRCKTTGDLDRFLNEKLKLISGVSRTRTTIVLSSVKESSLSNIIL
jgi:Lrp/AsnC family leucine-responsive transcriptional regulator